MSTLTRSEFEVDRTDLGAFIVTEVQRAEERLPERAATRDDDAP